MLKFRDFYLGGKKEALVLFKKSYEDIADITNANGYKLMLRKEVGKRFLLDDTSTHQGYALCTMGPFQGVPFIAGLVLIDLSDDHKDLDVTVEFTETIPYDIPKSEHIKLLASDLGYMANELGCYFYDAERIHLHLLNDIPFNKKAVELKPKMKVAGVKKNYVIPNPYHTYMPLLVKEMDAFDSYYQGGVKVFKRVDQNVLSQSNAISDATIEEYRQGLVPNSEIFNDVTSVVFDKEYGDRPANIIFTSNGEVVYNHYKRVADELNDGDYQTIDTHIYSRILEDDVTVQISSTGHGELAMFETASTPIKKTKRGLELETDYFPDGDDAIVNFTYDAKTGNRFYRGRARCGFSTFSTEVCYQVDSDGQIKSCNVDFNDHKEFETRQERVRGSYMLRIKPDSVKLFYAHRRGQHDVFDTSSITPLLSADGVITSSMIDGIIAKAIEIINERENGYVILDHPSILKLDTITASITRINDILSDLRANLPESHLKDVLDKTSYELEPGKKKTYN